MNLRAVRTVAAALVVTCAPAVVAGAAADRRDSVKSVVDAAIVPLMKRDHIPGVAVGVTVGGKTFVYNYGLASAAPSRSVTDSTLFEVGSISKTFTATLASYAQVNRRLSLSDKTSTFVPSLRGTSFGDLTLLNLGTHTSGGLPLQVPDYVTNEDQLLAYFRAWRPAHAPGTYRNYGNPGIGMLGVITAKSMHEDFVTLMERRLFPALGMTESYIHVPEARMADYAEGYTKNGAPIRMTFGVLSPEAAGVKSTATDLIRFARENMQAVALDPKLQRAIAQTHTGYFRAGGMTQDLIWEQYPYPVTLSTLLQGNSPAMLFDANPVSKIEPPEAPRSDVWLNKTGSTNGFGAYVAYVPQKQIGVVILANKSYPIAERVATAYRILTRL